ncbi:hypothetical protein METP3_00119 [Methanosarcinales archaeon]|nr:hypothetical protein METP3_00119 [Methanosarcinales archaeon]
MRYITNILILFILLFAGINVASAAGELTFNRMIYVSEWGGALTTQADVDKVIEDAAYSRADAIGVLISSNYFEAARDPIRKGKWDNRINTGFSNQGLPLFEYFIRKAHEKNIEVHLWIDVNIVISDSDSKYKLFGPSVGFPYNEVSRSGYKKTDPLKFYRLDIAFKEFQDYEISFLSWIATKYPELDGIHIEEPIYTMYSYSTAVRERVKTKFSYDPMYPPSGKTQIQVEADIGVIQREAWNEFFTKLKKSIDAVNAKRLNKIQLSANAMNYVPARGFDPKYMSDNMLLDWYAAQTPADTLEKFKAAIKYTHDNKVTQIPYVAIVYLTWSYVNGALNPAFFDQIRYAYDYNADGLTIFNWNYINERKTLNGQNILGTLHNIIPPSSNTPSATAAPTATVSKQLLSSITVSPLTASMGVGSTQTFVATPKDQSGSPMATSITWTSSNPAIGTITNSGIFTALKEGTTTITATYGSVSGNANAVIKLSASDTINIENQGFESGTTSWQFFTDGTGAFRTASPSYEGSKSANVIIGSSASNIQLYQYGITLEPNTAYRLSFSAYSTNGNDMKVKLFRHNSPYTNYGLDFTADLGKSWNTFTTEFTTAGFSGAANDGRLQFWFAQLAAAQETYYIDDIRLEKVSPPNITTHPSDQSVDIGQTATFSVIATNTASLTYQWQKNGEDIPGAISASYTTPSTTLSDDGSTFSVKVTNSAGSITSSNAILIVTSKNLIENPIFESGTTSWSFYTTGRGSFTAESPDNEVTKSGKIVLANSASNIQLFQEDVALEPNTLYRLSFDAYSNTGHDMDVRLIKDVSPYTNYGLDFTVDLGTDWQTFTTEFTTDGFTGTVKDGRLQFWLAPFASAGDTYYIDDVWLEKIN